MEKSGVVKAVKQRVMNALNDLSKSGEGSVYRERGLTLARALVRVQSESRVIMWQKSKTTKARHSGAASS